MTRSSTNPFFNIPSLKPHAKFEHKAITVPKGASITLAKVEGQRGVLETVHVVFEDEDDLFLKITLDREILFNFSHTQIEDDGAGKLSVPLLYGLNTHFGVTRSTASYWGIMWNAGLLPKEFRKFMYVEAVNKGAADFKVQGHLVTYGVCILPPTKMVESEVPEK